MKLRQLLLTWAQELCSAFATPTPKTFEVTVTKPIPPEILAKIKARAGDDASWFFTRLVERMGWLTISVNYEESTITYTLNTELNTETDQDASATILELLPKPECLGAGGGQ